MSEIWIDIITNVFVSLAILIGTFFIFSSSVGMIRFPDIYTRLHAATKASTLGIIFLILGAFLYLYVKENIVSGKLLLAIFFIFLTNPVAGHMLSRAAHHDGVKPVHNKYDDAYKNYLKKR